MPGEPRQRISYGPTWEERVGYARALRVGSSVFVAGTTATNLNGSGIGNDDAYAQTSQSTANISRALEQSHATFSDVVRYHTYLTRQEDGPQAARPVYEAFGEIRPVNMLIGFAPLVDPRMLLAIDVDADTGSGLNGN